MGDDTSLSPDQRVAALLDAQGFESTEIAKATGFKVKQVAAWRREAEYKAEVERIREAGLTELRDTVRKVSRSLLDAADLAVAALTSALGATKDDGTPDWYVIQRAAETILHASGGLITPKQVKGGEANAGAVPFASITVNLDGGSGGSSEPAEDVTDADVVEEDAPRYITAG